jgi:hypothetical protein
VDKAVGGGEGGDENQGVEAVQGEGASGWGLGLGERVAAFEFRRREPLFSPGGAGGGDRQQEEGDANQVNAAGENPGPQHWANWLSGKPGLVTDARVHAYAF